MASRVRTLISDFPSRHEVNVSSEKGLGNLVSTPLSIGVFSAIVVRLVILLLFCVCSLHSQSCLLPLTQKQRFMTSRPRSLNPHFDPASLTVSPHCAQRSRTHLRKISMALVLCPSTRPLLSKVFRASTIILGVGILPGVIWVCARYLIAQ